MKNSINFLVIMALVALSIFSFLLGRNSKPRTIQVIHDTIYPPLPDVHDSAGMLTPEDTAVIDTIIVLHLPKVHTSPFGIGVTFDGLNNAKVTPNIISKKIDTLTINGLHLFIDSSGHISAVSRDKIDMRDTIRFYYDTLPLLIMQRMHYLKPNYSDL